MRIYAYSFGRFIVQEFIKSFKALSDETRLRILNIVSQRECCVCEVMQVLDISQSRASRNLRMLEDAGILKSRREGLWAYYTLKDDPEGNFPVLLAKMVEEFSEKSSLFKKDRAQLKKTVRLGNACAEDSGCRRKSGKDSA